MRRWTSHASVDRYTLPVAVTVLMFAVATITVALVQSIQLRDAYEERDRALAAAAANYVEEYLSSRHREDVEWLAEHSKLLELPPNRLAERVQLEYLVDGVNEPVAAVAVIDREGQIAVWRSRGDSLVEMSGELLSAVSSEVLTIADQVSSSRLHAWHGLDAGRPGGNGGAEHRFYAQALPLGSSRYTAWIAIVDASATPLADFFAVDRGGDATSLALLSDDEKPLLGQRVDRQVSEAVAGTSWSVAAGRIASPRTIPTWLFVILLLAVVALGASYLVQDRARRRLREAAEVAADRAESLFGLAHELLAADGIEHQAVVLATHTRRSLDVPGVEVRIAGRRSTAVCDGVQPPDARTYRVAICGPAGAVGELRVFTAGSRLPVDGQRDARTVAAVAGAALHTQLVVERERTTARELQRVDELRTNLLSTVAHELRSPLAAVKGVLGLLEMSGHLGAREREYVAVAGERTDALVSLIRDLFARSLIDAGKLELDQSWQPAEELLRTSLGALVAAEPDGIGFEAEPQLRLLVDPLRFDQIVTNLVSNARKYGACPIRVELRSRPAGGAQLVVIDHGPGIPADQREAIFGRYYQAHAAADHASDGAGLGLSLVDGLVALHGGHIAVSPTLPDGTGATFTVVFPDAQLGSGPLRRAS